MENQQTTDWEGYFQMFALQFAATTLAMIVAMLIINRSI